MSDDRFLRAKGRTYVGLQKEAEGTWNGPFYFIQIADTQLGFIADPDRKGDTGDYEAEEVLVNKCVDAINAMVPPPKFVTCCGDLVHHTPDEKPYQKQVDGFKRLMSRLREDIPLVCCCGNHDIGNTPSPTAIQSYVDRFGDDYFEFWACGTQNIVLNSQLWYDHSAAPEEYEKQHRWLEERLAAGTDANAKHKFLYQHISWFLGDGEEENQYFNIPLKLRKPLLELCDKHNVTATFAGHYHRNAYGRHKGMEMITTSAVGMQLGDDVSGLRVVKVYESNITHEYFPLDNAPTSVSL
eukprot:GFYU01002256.1.p1 GENE.GFYU01002256.1~~GFYU01002256.1.p1  ORF type:complete len:318 (-),score=95.70 GFYU01002256.1:348-1238(-)